MFSVPEHYYPPQLTAWTARYIVTCSPHLSSSLHTCSINLSMMAALQLLVSALLLFTPVAFGSSFVGEPIAVSSVKYAHGNFLVPLASADKSVSARHLAHEVVEGATPANDIVNHNHMAKRKRFSRQSLSVSAPKAIEYSTLTNKTGYSFRFPGRDTHFDFQGMAAGNGYVVQGVNNAFRVYNATTGKPLVETTPMNQFFQTTYVAYLKTASSRTVTFGDNLAFPRVLYDGDAKRWYIFIVGLKGADVYKFKDPSFLLVAVSKSSNPLLGFQYYKYNIALEGTLHNKTGPCPCFPSAPQVGFDKNVVTVSLVSLSFSTYNYVGAQLYVLNKKDLINGVKTVSTIVYDGTPENDGYILEESISLKDGGIASSVQPASVPPTKTADKRFGGTQHYLSPIFTTVVDSRIGVWALTNTSSMATTSPKTKLSHAIAQLDFNYTAPLTDLTGTPLYYAAEQKEGYAPLAHQAGQSVSHLDVDSGVFSQVVYGSGLLFTAFPAQALPDKSGKNTTYIVWVVIQPVFNSAGSLKSASVKASGRIAIPGLWLSYPATTINAHRAVVTFSVSGSTLYPSIGYVYISLKTYKASDVFLGFEGVEPADGFTGLAQYGSSEVERWGDYYAAASDEKGYFWIAGQTTPGGVRTSQANWGTYIVQLPP
eukprot:TRINITY_DN8332_c0_g1_i1.p1 TRINITY_DN8332_c0_g1~~TRINITY_DN8332_c0_g1_i1.p1  ORF type:complete len:653 (+),score=26.01 TRINITY_DN8332_c0_g1_i1:69-2027(+)